MDNSNENSLHLVLGETWVIVFFILACFGIEAIEDLDSCFGGFSFSNNFFESLTNMN